MVTNTVANEVSMCAYAPLARVCNCFFIKKGREERESDRERAHTERGEKKRERELASLKLPVAHGSLSVRIKPAVSRKTTS